MQTALDLIGLFVFGISGALMAIHRDFDYLQIGNRQRRRPKLNTNAGRLLAFLAKLGLSVPRWARAGGSPLAHPHHL